MFPSQKSLLSLTCGILAVVLAAASPTAMADPEAQNIDLSTSPILRNNTKQITEAFILENAVGEDLQIISADNSTFGASVTWNATTRVITYNPNPIPNSTFDSNGGVLLDTFTYTIKDNNDDEDTGVITVRVKLSNSTPTISGVSVNSLNTNDKNTENTPFQNVTFSDSDDDDFWTVTVTIAPAEAGVLSEIDDFTEQGGGVYTISSFSLEDLQAAARAINFIPAENRRRPGQNEDIEIKLAITDGIDESENRRDIRILSINDVPIVIPGDNREMDDDKTLAIFSEVELVDPDLDEQLSVIVKFNRDKGTFSGTGFTVSGSGEDGVLTLTPDLTVATAQSTLRAIIFTPEPNQVRVDETEDLEFEIETTDRENATGSGTLVVEVLSINDSPELTPENVGPFNMSGGATIRPFQNITVTDVDFDETDPDPSNPEAPAPGDPFTAVITLLTSPFGEIISPDFGVDTATEDEVTYVYVGTRLQVQQAIRDARYLAPSIPGLFEVSLIVIDSSGKDNDTSNEVVAEINVTIPTPGVAGLVAGQQILDNATIFPFASSSFNNFGGTDRIVEITLDSDEKGEFDQLGGFDKTTRDDQFVYIFEGNSTAATAALRSLRYRPVANRIVGASESVTFTITVKATENQAELATASLVVTVLPFNDPPTITVPSEIFRINDDETTLPFANMVIADVDEGGQQLLQVTITMMGSDPNTNADRPGGGVFAPLDPDLEIPGVLFTAVGGYPNTVYRVSGTPAGVTEFMQELAFFAEANRNAIGERETVRFTVSVDDSKGGTAQNSGLSVVVTAVNGAPVIAGIPPLSQQPFAVAATGNEMTMPFLALSVTDDEEITLTITLDDADKGTLSTTDFTDEGDGVYSIFGTPADVTDALQALVYSINPTFPFPLNQPGLVTFTLVAQDSINTTTRLFTIFIRERSVAHIVSSTANSGPGSLREAIGIAGNEDIIVFDFPDDEFPSTINLTTPIVIDKNLGIIGSGVDQLKISGQGLTGIFTVENTATLTLEQLTLADGGNRSFGGAVMVDQGSRLVARYTQFLNNSAEQFGGAIDVYDGGLVIENCLFVGNFVSGSIAVAGGAISIYTNTPSFIKNTTFASNRQDNGGGQGGGAIYAENFNLEDPFHLTVEHCTFVDNEDEVTSGTAILSASAGTFVRVRNNIFVDQQGQVLDVLGGALFQSHGGNIATDATTTTFTVGSQNITLLGHVSDKLETDPMLGPLTHNFGATRTFAPLPGSPAIGTAIGNVPGTDQRGFWRDDASPDIGAHEAGSFKRININEIFADGGPGTDFLEFYNPRDSDTLDLNGFQIWLDGQLQYTFTSQVVVTGAGFAWTSPVDLSNERGRVELRDPAGRPVVLIDYVASFSEQGTELVTTGQSINRYPRYEGGFLPHQRVVENVTGIAGGNLTSPGDDVTGALLGGGNAPPIAVADVDDNFQPIYQMSALATLRPDVLANDIEFDRTDTLRITEVMLLDNGVVLNEELQAINGSGLITLMDLPSGLDTTITPGGATVTIDPDGRGLTYDPRTSPFFIGLALGETATDIIAYTIRDFDESNTPQSRGADPARQEDNIAMAIAYFTVVVVGENEAPEPQPDFAATTENQAIRMLADTTLLAPAIFDFGDLPQNFQDFDEAGNPITLLPPPPTLALLANDNDVDSDDDNTTLILAAVHTTEVPTNTVTTTSELGATVKLDIRANRAETSVLYDPRPSAILDALSAGETLDDSFYYSVLDRHGARGVAKVTITVTGVNDAPTARDVDGFVANQNASIEILGANLLANDTDPDGNDVLTIVTPFDATSELGAALTFDGTSITYDPEGLAVFRSLARNETIIDTFTYTITDSEGGTSTATVSVVVEGRNDPPVAADDLLEIFENETAIVSAADGLLANDVDVDLSDDPWVIPQRGVITPLGAALDIHPDGSFRYDANSPAIDSLIEGEIAIETFPYTVIDNFRTQATDDHFRVFANTTGVTLPVLLNDAVVGTLPTPVLSYSDHEGTLVIESPNHALRDGLHIRIEDYEGTGAYNGVFPITAIDRDHFSIDIPFVDDPADTCGAWIPWFSITAIAEGDKGGQLASPDGQVITYSPPSGFYGVETFRYTIDDGVGGRDVATVQVEVVLPRFNGFLSASDDRFRIGMGESAVLVDVLANDGIRPDLTANLTIVDVAPVAAASGSVTIVQGGQALAYTPPDPLFTGIESFTYTIAGGGPARAQATVTFVVVDRTNQLDGADDAFFVVNGSSNNLLDVLRNDAVLPNYPVTATTIVAVNGSTNGAATGSGGSVSIVDNQLSYTPPAAILTDTFTYTSRDASGATVTREVRVRVVPNTQNFYATDDFFTVVAGTGVVNLPVLLNDGAVQNPSAVFSITNLGLDTSAPPDVTRVSITNGTSISYTPPSFPTTETFTYEVGIGTLERRAATITIRVIDQYATNPHAENDFFHVAKNSAPQTLDVLKNDIPYPIAGWNSQVSSLGTPTQGGTVAIQNGGASISYTPAPGFFGIETFTYAVRDALGATASATVSVRVGEMLTTPSKFTVLQDTLANAMPVLANDDVLARFPSDYTISAVTPDSTENGTVEISGPGPDNFILYTPAPGFSGEDTFSYTVTDQTGGTRDETVTVNVIAINADRDHAELRVVITGVNDVPVLTGTADSAITDKESVNLFENVNITDLDEFGNQQQTILVSYNASFGTLTAPGMTQLSPGVHRVIGTPAHVSAVLRGAVFTPFENFIDYIDPGFADVVFTLSIDDGYVPAPLLDDTIVTVTPINDAPFVTTPIADRTVHINARPIGIYLPGHFDDVDDDVMAGELIWTVSQNTNPSLFSNVAVDPGLRLLSLTFAADRPGVSDITVRGTDRGGLIAETTFRVTVEGPPIVVLADGQTQPPPATFVQGTLNGIERDYRHAFRVRNTGTLPVSAFIVHVTNVDNIINNLPIISAALIRGQYTTNENGTPNNFNDDTRSAIGVAISQVGTYAYNLKYDLEIPPGESVIVHLTYRVASLDPVEVRPSIRISLSQPSITGAASVTNFIRNADGSTRFTANLQAGKTYRVESGDDLATWTPWPGALAGGTFSRSVEITDDGLDSGSHPSESPRRFYRLAEIPAP